MKFIQHRVVQRTAEPKQAARRTADRKPVANSSSSSSEHGFEAKRKKEEPVVVLLSDDSTDLPPVKRPIPAEASLPLTSTQDATTTKKGQIYKPLFVGAHPSGSGNSGAGDVKIVQKRDQAEVSLFAKKYSNPQKIPINFLSILKQPRGRIPTAQEAFETRLAIMAHAEAVLRAVTRTVASTTSTNPLTSLVRSMSTPFRPTPADAPLSLKVTPRSIGPPPSTVPTAILEEDSGSDCVIIEPPSNLPPIAQQVKNILPKGVTLTRCTKTDVGKKDGSSKHS